MLLRAASAARLSGKLLLLNGAAFRSPCGKASGSRAAGSRLERETHLPPGRSRLISIVVVASSSSSSWTPSSSSRRAFLPCSVKIVHVSKPCPLHDTLTQEWLDKARRYAKEVEEIRLPVNPQKAKDNDAATRAEGERVLRAIVPSDFVVLLDERGKSLTSEQLADLVAEAGERCSSSSSLAFVVGGPFGHAQAVSDRADATLGLSKLVLNHAVARVVLSEALYRAYTILKGVPYHH